MPIIEHCVLLSVCCKWRPSRACVSRIFHVPLDSSRTLKFVRFFSFISCEWVCVCICACASRTRIVYHLIKHSCMHSAVKIAKVSNGRNERLDDLLEIFCNSTSDAEMQMSSWKSWSKENQKCTLIWNHNLKERDWSEPENKCIFTRINCLIKNAKRLYLSRILLNDTVGALKLDIDLTLLLGIFN